MLGFGSSTSLAAAYGIAVTGTMAITTVLAFVVARRMWRWNLPGCAALFGAFLLVDVGFFSANLVKIVDGGWFPLAFGLGVFVLMSTWKRGRELLYGAHRGRTRFRCRISCRARRWDARAFPGPPSS